MKENNNIFHHTRRRFLGMLGALGTLLSWPAASASRKSKLSGREASFYRKGRRDSA